MCCFCPLHKKNSSIYRPSSSTKKIKQFFSLPALLHPRRNLRNHSASSASPLPLLLPPLSDDDTKTKDVVLNFENVKNLAARFHRIWPSKQISFGCYEININMIYANGILVKIPCLLSSSPHAITAFSLSILVVCALSKKNMKKRKRNGTISSFPREKNWCNNKRNTMIRVAAPPLFYLLSMEIWHQKCYCTNYQLHKKKCSTTINCETEMNFTETGKTEDLLMWQNINSII